ncbi:glycosyltransferase family 4 protein [uncultured Polaribacter sp.]|uniref:glycosyltransferase family 4 protein n=1 Tax=uncultured Polaribacter sp. TaxID=174711 RepID=UPI002607EF3F|nr:glycosyltransferase family 4 protein [uncultured Polaribacter sp.]
MKKIKVLYIGNNLTKKTKYNSTYTVLSDLLEKEGYIVYKSSSKQNKVLRILDMVFSFFKNKRKVNYILIDTYSTYNFYYAFIISQLARIYSVKYITILHGGNLPYRISNSKWLSKLIFKNSYKNIAPSNYLKIEFEKHGFITDLIPNILEVEKYQFKKRDVLAPKLLWVRAFKHIYNPTLAIKVFKEVKSKYKSAKLCMIGPFVDSSYNQCLSLVKKYNLEDSIEFTGVLLKEEWHKKSEDFDIFLNTTDFDNTPVSVMEAMALGLPVISTNVGGIPYLLENKKDALLVEKNNSKMFYNAVILLLKNENKQIIYNARKKVESFKWKNLKTKWHKILKDA